MTKPSKKIIVVSCIDCPWCWLIHEIILKFKHTNYEFSWVPLILKWDVDENGESFHKSLPEDHGWSDKQLDEYANSARMISEAKSLQIKWEHRTTRYNVIKASIFAMYAKEKGFLNTYITHAFRQYFLAPSPSDKNIARVEILEQITKKSGHNPAEVKRVLDDPKYKILFQQILDKYVVSSVPTFIYKDRKKSSYVSKNDFPSFIDELTKD